MCWCLGGNSKQHTCKCWSLPTHACISSTTAELQASRVTIATATVQPNCVHQGCSKAGNVNSTLTYQLQSGQVLGQGAKQGRAFNWMLSGIVRVYRCMSYDELVRLCSFGSLVLWISLRSPSDLLY